MSSATVLRAALTACRRVRVPIAACMVPCTSFRPAATIHTSRPRAQETADAARGLPSNVILDARAEQVLRSSEDAIDDPIAGLGRVHAIAGIPFEDVDVGASKLLTRLGEVGTRPIKDPVLELPVFDIMATAFQPLSRQHPRAQPVPEGSESPEVAAEPEPAAARSTVALDPAVWDEPMRVDILHRVVRWQLSKRRTTAYRARTYNEKSGSGRKPFRQKGTGSARQGNKRAPLQRGGLKAHGPQLRDWSHKLNKQVRRKGLRVALSAKLRDNKVTVVTGLGDFASAKTADLQRRLHAAVEGHRAATSEGAATQGYGVEGSALVVVHPAEATAAVEAASRSLNKMVLVPQLGCTTYDVLRMDRLVVSEQALKLLEERLRR